MTINPSSQLDTYTLYLHRTPAPPMTMMSVANPWSGQLSMNTAHSAFSPVRT